MKSKFLNELLNENYKNQNEDFANIIDLVISSDKFHIFEEMMEDIREEYFVKDTIHGISHNERVAFLVMAIGIHEGLSETELKIVIKAALYHDIGRTIAKGRAHGIESAKIINEYKEELANGFNDEELNLLNFLCCIHSNPDEEMDAFAKQYNMDLNIAKKLMNVLKDADALDRVRLSRFGKLDESFLRLDYSKILISISNDLLNFYRNIQSTKTYTIENFNSSVFETNRFNIIEDDENIYVFRAVNQDNEADLDNPDIDIIRTKSQVAANNSEPGREIEDDNRSLEEVYGTTRVSRLRRINNCVSFSSNSNVTLDYKSRRYIMYAIPKNGDNSIFLAGKYMLEEINKKISSTLETENVDDEVLEILHKIDEQETNKGIVNLVGESLDYLRVNNDHNRRFTGKDNHLTTKESLISRFEKKQFLNEKQQLEYSKIIAKLTILENSGILRSILPSQSTNSSLIAAIGSAFSSSELIHYGSIQKGQVTEISKEYIELFSIIQQMQEQSDIDQELVKLLKLKILNDIKNKREIHVDNNIIPENQDELSPEFAIDYFRKDQESTSIIPYYTGKIAMEYTKNYALAKLRTYKLLCILRDQFQDEQTKQNIDFFIQQIIDKVVVPDSSIIGRRNNRGISLVESVNLDLNPNKDITIFSIDEQKRLITTLNGLSYDELIKIANGDYRVIKEKGILTDCINSKDYNNGKNDYYIDYIIDSIDFENIYKVSNIREDKKGYLKEKLKEKLGYVEISKLYSALINAGINYEKVPYYVVNLLLEDGYKDYNTFEELVNSDNLEQIIKENVNNLNKNITAYSLDIFLGILDNSYIVPNTNIKLREYQEHAVNGIDKIFENRRFAGVVLPTGAGKSFVAMAEMMKFQKKNIVYFAPQEEILNQFQKHILKYVLQKSILTIEDVSKMELMTNEQLQEFLKDKVYNQDANIVNELKKLKNSSLTEDEKDKIRRSLLPRKTEKHDDIQDTIKEVFPHLEMYCYQSLNSSEYENLLKKNADLIVFDELHRTGAATWQPRIKGLLEANESAKILGITATPIRDDKDHVDMMKFMATQYGGFTEEEIKDKAYLAEEMYLIDAMQNKYVVEPQIVSFTATLGSTEEYQFVVERLNEERKKNPSSDLVKELETIKEKMDEIISSGRDVVENNLSAIGNVIHENIPVSLKNGRFIVFLPTKPESFKGSSEEYVKSQVEKINEMLKIVNPDIDSGYLLSNRQEKFKNSEAISNFETADNDVLKVLYAINMLNEGVHVENINGEIMLRKIGSDSNILYFQQIGRVIFAIDPENPPSEDERPIIFDVYNNYLSRNLDRVANMTTPTSDLNNIQMIKNWIVRHERMPDINSQDQSEARKAITLKKIQEKYEGYLNGINGDNLSETEKREIVKILEIAKSINLFECDIPDRIVQPGEREIGRVNAFKIKGEIKSFLDLFKESKKVLNKGNISNTKEKSGISETIRIKNIMLVLQILSEYGFNITDENFVSIFKKINPDKEETLAKKNLTLLDVIESYFSQKSKESVIKELGMEIDELKEFLIYEEFDYVRDIFCFGNEKLKNVFSYYDIKDIRKCGILRINGINTIAVYKRFYFREWTKNFSRYQYIYRYEL